MDTPKQRPLSDWFYLIIVLVIARHLIHAVTLMLQWQPAQVLQHGDTVIRVATHYTTIYNLAISALLVTLLCFIMAARRWALMGFFILQMGNAFIQGAMQGSTDADFAQHFFVALVNCIVMRLLLCIRKDGRSGWQVIMGERRQAVAVPVAESESEAAPVAESLEEADPAEKTAPEPEPVAAPVETPAPVAESETEADPVATPEPVAESVEEAAPEAAPVATPVAEELPVAAVPVAQAGRRATKLRLWLLCLLPVALLGVGVCLFLRSDAFRQWRVEKQYEEARARLEANPNSSDVLAAMRGLADSYHHVPACLYMADYYDENDSARQAAHYYLQVDAAYENSGTQDTVMYNKLLLSLLNAMNQSKKDTLRTYYTAIPQRMLKRNVCLPRAYELLTRYYFMYENNVPMSLYHAEAAISVGSAYGWLIKGFLYLYHTTPLNYSKARFCFLMCIELAPDNEWPYYYLGLMYKYGRGVQPSRAKAKEYFKQAIDRGSENAKEEYARLLMEE